MCARVRDGSIYSIDYCANGRRINLINADPRAPVRPLRISRGRRGKRARARVFSYKRSANNGAAASNGDPSKQYLRLSKSDECASLKNIAALDTLGGFVFKFCNGVPFGRLCGRAPDACIM